MRLENRRQKSLLRFDLGQEKVGGGASIDIFPAGFRYHVALKLENAVTDASPEAVIPYIGETELWRMLEAAMKAARQTTAEPAPEPATPAHPIRR